MTFYGMHSLSLSIHVAHLLMSSLTLCSPFCSGILPTELIAFFLSLQQSIFFSDRHTSQHPDDTLNLPSAPGTINLLLQCTSTLPPRRHAFSQDCFKISPPNHFKQIIDAWSSYLQAAYTRLAQPPSTPLPSRLRKMIQEKQVFLENTEFQRKGKKL